MELTAENLIEKEIEVDGVKTTAIQHLIDQLHYGSEYKSTFVIKSVDLTRLTKVVFVLGHNNAKELTIDLVYITKNQYWVVTELLKLGFELNLQA